MLKDIRIQFALAFMGALTLVTRISDLKEFSDWSRYILENWKWFLHLIWFRLFGMFGIIVTPEQAIVLSLLVFYVGLFLSPLIEGKKYRPLDLRPQKNYASLALGCMLLITANIAAFIKGGLFPYNSVIFGAACLISIITFFAFLLEGKLIERLIGALSYTILFSIVIIAGYATRSSLKYEIITAIVITLATLMPAFAPSRVLVVRVTLLVAFIFAINIISRAPKYIEELKTEAAKVEAQSQDHKP